MTSSSGGSSAKDAMKEWLGEVLPDKNIRNFTRDWNDGRLLLCLVDALQPGVITEEFPDDPLERCRYAIDLAEEYLQVPRLLQAEDLCNPAVDELSVMTYLSYFVSLGDVEDTGDVDQLLDWVHGRLPSCNLTNFDSDWHSGIALVGLVDSLAPGACPDWMDLNPDAGEENFQMGIDLARQHLDVDLELAAEELVASGVGNDLGFMPLIAELQTAGIEVEAARQCFAFGDGLIDAVVGQKAVFTVQHQTRVSLISVEIVTADGAAVAGQVSEGQTSTELVIGYTPLAEGDCRIRIMCHGRNIPNSPFTVPVMPEPDAASCRVFGTGLGTVLVGTKQDFKVDARKAGPGQLKVLLQDVKSTTADVQPLPNEDGVFKVTYTPLEVGQLEVLVLWAGKLIDNCPGPVMVIDPSKVILAGEGLKTGCAGQQTVFTADARLAGPGELQVKFGLGHVRDKCRITPSREDNNILVVEYEPVRPGKLQMDVQWSGIPLSPGKYTIPIVKAGYTGAVSLDTDKITLGEVVNLTARLQGGGKSSSNAKLTAKARGLRTGVTPVQVKVSGNDQFHIEMKPKEADEYFIDVFFDNVPVAGSPLRAVFANPCHPELVVAAGPSDGTVGRRLEFLVDTSKAGGGDLEVNVTGPAHGDLFVTIEEGDSPTQHRLFYTPDAEGQHSLDISWSGTPVPGSPFKLEVAQEVVDPSKVVVHYDAEQLDKLLLGEAFVMAFDTTEAGYDEFSAMAVAEATTQSHDISVIGQDEDVHTLTFEPPMPGNYSLYVFYGENQVANSPFSLRVITGASEVEVESIRFGDVGDPVLIALRLAEISKKEFLSVTAQSKEDLEPEVISDLSVQDDGTLLAQYMPTISGQHHFEVTWRSGQIVDGSFDVDITPSRQHQAAAVRTRITGPSSSPQRASRRRSGVANLVKNTFAEATVGERVSASIQSPGTAVDSVKGRVTDPEGKVTSAEVLSNSMGTFTIFMLPTAVGKHEMEITIADRPITGSPFFFHASATAEKQPMQKQKSSTRHNVASSSSLGDPSQCSITHVPKDVMVGTGCRFVVNARNAGPGDLTVSVASGPLRQTDISVSLLRERVYSVQLAPWVPGNVQICINWAGRPIPGSPVAINFLDCIPDAAKCHANTESPIQVATNRWQRVSSHLPRLQVIGGLRGTTAFLIRPLFRYQLIIFQHFCQQFFE